MLTFPLVSTGNVDFSSVSRNTSMEFLMVNTHFLQVRVWFEPLSMAAFVFTLVALLVSAVWLLVSYWKRNQLDYVLVRLAVLGSNTETQYVGDSEQEESTPTPNSVNAVLGDVPSEVLWTIEDFVAPQQDLPPEVHVGWPKVNYSMNQPLADIAIGVPIKAAPVPKKAAPKLRLKAPPLRPPPAIRKIAFLSLEACRCASGGSVLPGC